MRRVILVALGALTVVLLTGSCVECASGVKGYATQQREEYVYQQQQLAEPQEPVETRRYESKTQVSRDELAKGQALLSPAPAEQQVQVQRGELSKTAPAATKGQEPLRQEELKQEEFKQEELRQEQQELPPLPVQQQVVQLVEQQAQQAQQVQQVQHEEPTPVKGAAKGREALVVAPAGEAEPYAFSYQVEGSSRSESGDSRGVVRGQYSLMGGDGSQRIVDYVADGAGFRASVSTNEFGTEGQSPASVALRSSQPAAEDITLRLEGKTRDDLLAPHLRRPEVAASAVRAPVAAFAPAKGAAPHPVPLQLPLPAQQQQQQQLPVQATVLVPAQAPVEEPLVELPLAAPVATPTRPVERLTAPAATPRQQKAAAAAVAPVASRFFESASAHRVYAAPAPRAGARLHAPVRAAPVAHAPYGHTRRLVPAVPAVAPRPLAAAPHYAPDDPFGFDQADGY